MPFSACASGDAERSPQLPRWVVVRGRAAGEQALVAPLSGRGCLLYRIDTSWRELFSAGGRQLIAGRPFELQPLQPLQPLQRASDGDASCGPTPALEIDASAASLTLPSRRLRTRCSLDPELGRRLDMLCHELGRRPPRWPARWREARIEVGQALRISGWLSWLPSASSAQGPGSYREPPQRPRLRAERIEVHV
jgi:hypothetical protein